MIYSQSEEQIHIMKAVGWGTGRFLDIGAWHAKELSNTRALFECGWSGVMIEPSPEPFLGLLREYGKEERIQLLCGAIGVSRSIARFHATSDALTTSSEESYERWKSVGGFYGSFYAPVITIHELVARFGEFDFVSIDSEGSSVDLLHELLAAGLFPSCICVEYDLRCQECMDAAAKKGYRVLYTSAENVVFGR